MSSVSETEEKGDMRERDAGVLDRLRENTRVHVGLYSTRVCLADCVYSNFPHLANNCLHLLLHVSTLDKGLLYCIALY